MRGESTKKDASRRGNPASGQKTLQTPSRPCENSAWRDSQTAGAILESGMAHISGFERDQLLLLPEAVDDYVG
ncbi:MAG TPA: hypothetical protein VKG91_13650, partial [Roseiarcus sp.]|nr:hypothetical protein [Roseiarcus sp.]